MARTEIIIIIIIIIITIIIIVTLVISKVKKRSVNVLPKLNIYLYYIHYLRITFLITLTLVFYLSSNISRPHARDASYSLNREPCFESRVRNHVNTALGLRFGASVCFLSLRDRLRPVEPCCLPIAARRFSVASSPCTAHFTHQSG